MHVGVYWCMAVYLAHDAQRRAVNYVELWAALHGRGSCSKGQQHSAAPAASADASHSIRRGPQPHRFPAPLHSLAQPLYNRLPRCQGGTECTFVFHFSAQPCTRCRAVDASGDEALALQERAVWDLLALFFLDAQQAQQGLVAQVSAHAASADGVRGRSGPAPTALPPMCPKCLLGAWREG